MYCTLLSMIIRSKINRLNLHKSHIIYEQGRLTYIDVCNAQQSAFDARITVLSAALTRGNFDINNTA